MNTPEQAASSGPERPASTTGSTPSPPPLPGLDEEGRERRRRGYHLRAGQRSMVGDIHTSLACCGRGTLPAQAGGDGHARLWLRHSEGRAEVAGTTRCGSVWGCPVCAPRIATRRAEALRPQVGELMGKGWSAHLLTMTVRHQRQHSPVELFEALRAAWERVTSGAAWRRVRERGGVEYARGYDVTWSPGNGWHPHLHLSLYLGPEHEDPDAVGRWLLARWIDSLARLGWDALPGAQDLQRCHDPEAAARYAVTPAAVYESLAMAMKRSRGAGSGATPFEILARAVDGDAAAFPFKVSKDHARALWCEYIEATKGRRQVTTSRGLTLAADEDLVAPEDSEEVDELAVIGPLALRELDWRRMTAPLLDAVEGAAGDHLVARRRAHEVLAVLAATDWWIRMFNGDPPDPDG